MITNILLYLRDVNWDVFLILLGIFYLGREYQYLKDKSMREDKLDWD